MSTVTVLSGPERRRRWSLAEKLEIVGESLAPEASVAAVARRHDVHPNLVHLWRRQARTGVLGPVPRDGPRFARVALAAGDDVGERKVRNPAGTGIVEIVLRNGRVMRLSREVSAAYAAQLADALEA
jgi:transposase